MNTSFTPGPWWRDDDGFIAAGANESYVTIASPNCSKDIEIDEREANTRLIKASPLLFSLLVELKEARGGKENLYGCAEKALDPDYIAKVESAINLATGQEP